MPSLKLTLKLCAARSRCTVNFPSLIWVCEVTAPDLKSPDFERTTLKLCSGCTPTYVFWHDQIICLLIVWTSKNDRKGNFSKFDSQTTYIRCISTFTHASQSEQSGQLKVWVQVMFCNYVYQNYGKLQLQTRKFTLFALVSHLTLTWQTVSIAMTMWTAV